MPTRSARAWLRAAGDREVADEADLAVVGADPAAADRAAATADDLAAGAPPAEVADARA